MRRCRASISRRFTLVEILVGALLVSILMGLAFQVMTEGMSYWEHEEKQARGWVEARTILKRMGHEVRSCALTAGGGKTSLAGTTRLLRVRTFADNGAHPRWLEYRMGSPDGQSPEVLVRRVLDEEGTVISAQTYPHITGFEVEFTASGGEQHMWRGEWPPGETRLPAGVRVSVKMSTGGPGPDERVFASLFAVPAR